MTPPILEARALEAFYGAVQVIFGVNLNSFIRGVEQGIPEGPSAEQ